MELRLPILLVMPKARGYSFLKQRSLQAQLDSGEEREAMFMGLGDIVIPGVLAVSAKATLGWGVGLGALLGGLAGFAVLMHFVLGGRPQAGLPLLNGGAILGWAFAAILLTGSLGL
jgi:presenilin-like A22 family membrane protease